MRVLRIEFISSLDLVIVQGDASDLALQELANVAHGSSDTAADIQNVLLWSVAVVELRRQYVFVSANGLVKGFLGVLEGEMEALAPAPLVEYGRQVVVGVNECLVLGGAIFCRCLAMEFAVLVNARVDRAGGAEFRFLRTYGTVSTRGEKSLYSLYAGSADAWFCVATYMSGKLLPEPKTASERISVGKELNRQGRGEDCSRNAQDDVRQAAFAGRPRVNRHH